MGFSYKTSWLAVRDTSPEAVADALRLRHRHAMDWTRGTGAAYEQGVFVARPVPSWTLAHGRIHLPGAFDASDPRVADWVRELSTRLGEVQFFTTDRTGEHHGWARAVHGEVIRAYHFGDAAFPLFIGEPTDIENELGVGTRTYGEEARTWDDAQRDAFYRTVPRERHVMAVARRWSICPDDIPEESVTEPGIHGFPPGIEPR